MIDIINGQTPISEIKVGDFVIRDEMVKKVASVGWSRMFDQWEIEFEGDSKTYHFRDYEGADSVLPTVHVVAVLS